MPHAFLGLYFYDLTLFASSLFLMAPKFGFGFARLLRTFNSPIEVKQVAVPRPVLKGDHIMSNPVHVTVTGAAGQIGYALLFRIASGQLLGPDTPVVLRLLEIEPAMKALDGTVMELVDCAFPLLSDVVTTSDPKTAFDGTSFGLLVGAFPRKKGMERGDLLAKNAEIFQVQGQAIATSAKDDVRIFVVGNPANTNCLIARRNAPDVPSDRWFAMMRLDENRAKAQLAQKTGTPVSQVSNLAVWGNHSATQFPDAWNAKIGGGNAAEKVDNEEWLKTEFLTTIQQRGAKIIEARGASSAASAANALVDSVNAIIHPTPDGDWSSLAVCSKGEYGVPEGLQFGFPIQSDGSNWKVVEGIEHGDFAKEKIAATTKELQDECDAVKDLLPS